MHRIGIGHYFQASISATVFGIAKPDARIVHAAASAVQAQPHEVLHVGDAAAPHATEASLLATRELLAVVPVVLAEPPQR